MTRDCWTRPRTEFSQVLTWTSGGHAKWLRTQTRANQQIDLHLQPWQETIETPSANVWPSDTNRVIYHDLSWFNKGFGSFESQNLRQKSGLLECLWWLCFCLCCFHPLRRRHQAKTRLRKCDGTMVFFFKHVRCKPHVCLHWIPHISWHTQTHAKG